MGETVNVGFLWVTCMFVPCPETTINTYFLIICIQEYPKSQAGMSFCMQTQDAVSIHSISNEPTMSTMCAIT